MTDQQKQLLWKTGLFCLGMTPFLPFHFLQTIFTTLVSNTKHVFLQNSLVKMAVMYHVTSVTSWLFYFFLLNDLHKVTAVHFSWQYA